MAELISVRGARENDLCDVDLDVAFGRITVFTGEMFPAFVRNRLPQLGKPDVDSMSGLSASIVIDQKPFGGNAPSTP